MPYVVIYDACVLYPPSILDLLVQLAADGVVRARWTDKILDERFGSFAAKNPHVHKESLDRTRSLMNQAVPDCLVAGYESLIETIDLPDPKDRHVVAAAILAGAQGIVTYNLKDFPVECLPNGIEARHPDDFVCDAIDLDVEGVVRSFETIQRRRKSPPMTSAEILARYEANDLQETAKRLRPLCSMG